jgi:hypothetical protein
LANLVALSIGSIPPAFADESGPNPNTTFNELPGVIADAPAQNAPAPTRRGEELQSSHGPWLFPPIVSRPTSTRVEEGDQSKKTRSEDAHALRQARQQARL